MLYKHLNISYYYDIICGNQKNQKKNIKQKEIKFTFAWCSWIFDLMSDGRDTTKVKFTHEPFTSARYPFDNLNWSECRNKVPLHEPLDTATLQESDRPCDSITFAVYLISFQKDNLPCNRGPIFMRFDVPRHWKIFQFKKWDRICYRDIQPHLLLLFIPSLVHFLLKILRVLLKCCCGFPPEIFIKI